ncbi:MAG: hypothetical protein ABIY55_19540 [Kofleriaceae bacterium]
MLKVFLCGEGNNDLGTRWHDPPGDARGVIEALLARARPSGWRVGKAIDWKSIRKYRAGAARNTPSHFDVRNLQALVQLAYEEACEMLVFLRDCDGEDGREHAVNQAVATIAELGFEDEYRYKLAIVGGVPRPNLEGWILCLLGVTRTDEMTNTRAENELKAHNIKPKSTAHYLEIADTAPLPIGDGSLARWCSLARKTFDQLIDGVTA